MELAKAILGLVDGGLFYDLEAMKSIFMGVKSSRRTIAWRFVR
jgi:hypothetical protein